MLTFGMQHHLVDIYQVGSKYATGAKTGVLLGLYRENMTKSSCLNWHHQHFETHVSEFIFVPYVRINMLISFSLVLGSFV